VSDGKGQPHAPGLLRCGVSGRANPTGRTSIFGQSRGSGCVSFRICTAVECWDQVRRPGSRTEFCRHDSFVRLHRPVGIKAPRLGHPIAGPSSFLCFGSRCAQIACRGLACFAISNEIEKDPLSLVEATHAGAFNSADMNEDVLAAVVWLNESKALMAIEPLHGSFCHIASSFPRPRGGMARSNSVMEPTINPDVCSDFDIELGMDSGT
jgi:hypothetical protein